MHKRWPDGVHHTVELASRYRSIGRLRGEVRRLLSAELAGIDALSRRVLGIVP